MYNLSVHQQLGKVWRWSVYVPCSSACLIVWVSARVCTLGRRDAVRTVPQPALPQPDLAGVRG